jgi:hypothetical protein
MQAVLWRLFASFGLQHSGAMGELSGKNGSNVTGTFTTSKRRNEGLKDADKKPTPRQVMKDVGTL